MMYRWAFLVPPLLILGCAHQRALRDYQNPSDIRMEREFYWGQATFLTNNQTNGTWTPEQCCQIANDRSKGLEARRVAAAVLLAYYVKPGFRTRDMKRVIPDGRWIDDCSISGGGTGTGDKPLLLEGWPLELDLFPDGNGRSSWRVYFTLSGGPWYSPDFLSVGKQFLRGESLRDSLQITEFVLYYPLPASKDGISGQVVERHNYKGVGIKVRLPGWYDVE